MKKLLILFVVLFFSAVCSAASNIKIAVISDVHDSPDNRKMEKYFADVLLLLKTEIKPDVLLITGDLVHLPEYTGLLKNLKALLDKADFPVIVLPGNHDPKAEEFYKIFDPAPDYLDVAGLRIVPFHDDEFIKGAKARRRPGDLDRMRNLDENKPTVLVQHVSLFGNDGALCPFNYENADDIFAAAKGKNIVLSVSGHFHQGYPAEYYSDFPTVSVPAFCDAKAPVSVFEFSPKGVLLSHQLHNVIR